MSTPKLCRHCQKNAVKRESNDYCSPKCAGVAKRKPGSAWRPELVGTLCPVCRRGRIKNPLSRTCSGSCGAAARKDQHVLQANMRKARAVQHAAYLERVRAELKEEVERLTAARRALTQQDLYNFGTRVGQRFYRRGVWYERARQKMLRRQQPMERSA